MIIDLTGTTSSEIASALLRARRNAGSPAMGMVGTIVVVVDESSPEAYERLILDVLLGDPPLFPQHTEVELAWKILDPVMEFWATHGKPEQYPSGAWGPSSAHDMLARDGRAWRRP